VYELTLSKQPPKTPRLRISNEEENSPLALIIDKNKMKKSKFPKFMLIKEPMMSKEKKVKERRTTM